MLVLTGDDKKTIHEAVLSAYPDWDDLEQLVQFEMNEKLATIVEPGGTSDVVFKLIGHYEERNLLSDFVQAAFRLRPKHDVLRALAARMCGGQSPTQATVVSPPVAGHGLQALASLMAESSVRQAVARFGSDFQAATEQIDLVASYKDLHDLLHTIQFQCLGQIAREAQRFPADETAREILVHHQMELQTLADRLGQVACRPCLPQTETLWVNEVGKAAIAIGTALTDNDGAQLQRAVQRVERVTSVQPAFINTRLNAAARALRLKALVQALTSVAARLDGPGFEPEQVATFRGSLTTLTALDGRFQALVADHDRWQVIDVELRRIRASLRTGVDELVSSWPLLQPLWGAVLATPAPWVAGFNAEVTGVDTGIATGDPTRLRLAFQRCYSVAVDRFYLVDRELKDLCGALRDVGRPLTTVLAMLG